jgi:hypothetical protein
VTQVFLHVGRPQRRPANEFGRGPGDTYAFDSRQLRVGGAALAFASQFPERTAEAQQRACANGCARRLSQPAIPVHGGLGLSLGKFERFSFGENACGSFQIGGRKGPVEQPRRGQRGQRIFRQNENRTDVGSRVARCFLAEAISRLSQDSA